jgi:hypothetical protein
MTMAGALAMASVVVVEVVSARAVASSPEGNSKR